MNNFPPVGDIKMSKVKGTYNTYKLELSYGQIEAIKQALEAKHDDPLADELLAMFNYYAAELPGPGEDEESAEERGAAANAAEEDFPLPMPPGQETAVGDEDANLPALPKPGEEEKLETEPTEAPPDETMDGAIDAALGEAPEDDVESMLPEPKA